jgi:SAM-dependent methyltransferase
MEIVAVTDLVKIAMHTQSIYEKNAERFDAERSKALFERHWLQRFAKLLPKGGEVLDVGCGSGRPIADFFVESGYHVTGVDFSEPLLAIARAYLPEAQWHHADMRNMDLGSRFHGVIGWHSFFHLTPDDQRRTLPVLVGHLEPEGALMLTVGHEEGEVIGHVGDDVVYHSSLSQDEYTQLLNELGLHVLSFVASDSTCGGSTILLAQKTTS